MARYAISREGEQAMLALSNSLKRYMNEILDANLTLKSAIRFCEDGLGIYCNDIWNIIDRNTMALENTYSDIMLLAQNIDRKAEEISEEISKLISFDGRNETNPVISGSTVDTGGLGKQNNSLIPNRKTPRNLQKSQYGFVEDSDGNLVYDSPMETDAYLYKTQGKAKRRYKGTCGLCCCANILRLAGVNLGELEMIEYASKTNSLDSDTDKLCDVGYWRSGKNGATNRENRKAILKHFGIESEICKVDTDSEENISDSNIDKIADYVSSGKGVILSVHASKLWKKHIIFGNDLHAVTVTSVKKSKDGAVLGFYICDSEKNGTKYYKAEDIINALTGAEMNVTKQIIR